MLFWGLNDSIDRKKQTNKKRLRTAHFFLSSVQLFLKIKGKRVFRMGLLVMPKYLVFFSSIAVRLPNFSRVFGCLLKDCIPSLCCSWWAIGYKWKLSVLFLGNVLRNPTPLLIPRLVVSLTVWVQTCWLFEPPGRIFKLKIVEQWVGEKEPEL